MILQIRPNTRKVNQHIDTRLIQQPLGSDTAPLQHLRAMQSSSRKDNLAVRLDRDALGILDAALAHDDARGVLVLVESYLIDAPARQEIETGSVLGWVPVAVDGVGACGC